MVPRLILLFVLLFGFTGNAFGEENSIIRDETIEMAKDFAECNGVFKAYSEILKTVYPSTSENMAGLSRGSYVASLYILQKLGIVEKKELFIESISYGSHSKVRALFENRDEEATLILELMVKKCTTLNKLQAQIIDTWRKEAYKLK